MKKLILLNLILATCCLSCKKDNQTPNSSSNSQPGVYTAGEQYIAGQGSTIEYWKDGIPTLLVTNNLDAFATSIFVSNNIVYVCGYELINYKFLAKYWKSDGSTTNEVILNDPTTNARANSIFVSGSDVYVAGIADNLPTYWKNSTAINLTGNGTPNSILVSGQDIYISGGSGGYWKNGVIIKLPNCDRTTSISVSGSDVYAVGTFNVSGTTLSDLKYWKNGTEVILAASIVAIDSYPSIYVSGSDVYVTGGLLVNGQYWKNGKAVSLPNGAATSIFVSGSDVYIAGTEFNVASYWKNSSVVNLTNGTNARANSIFVVK